MLSTPLYTTVFRGNPREGLFYLDGQLGPVPWNYLTGQPVVDPAEWDPDNFFPTPQSQECSASRSRVSWRPWTVWTP